MQRKGETIGGNGVHRRKNTSPILKPFLGHLDIWRSVGIQRLVHSHFMQLYYCATARQIQSLKKMRIRPPIYIVVPTVKLAYYGLQVELPKKSVIENVRCTEIKTLIQPMKVS